MRDPSPPPLPPESIPFDPAPHTGRHDGWTPERQRGFVEALGRIGVVSAAARAVGKSAKSAYALRKRAGAEGFAAAWDMALMIGGDRARDLAIQRATEGVVQPVFYRGRQVGERRAFDNRLLIAALRHHGLRPAAWSLTDGL